jgi:hypothetical protein
MRSLTIARELLQRGCQTKTLIRKSLRNDRVIKEQLIGNLVFTDYLQPQHTSGYQNILIDSFPKGWKSELSSSLLKPFTKKMLIARYNRSVSLPDIQSGFDSILKPYSAEHDEWSQNSNIDKYLGPITRHYEPRCQANSAKLMVVDTEKRCGAHLITLLKKVCQRSGLILDLQFELPKLFNASKTLIVGAGYNTFYELADRVQDIRFIPIHKRYDDQHLRVRKFSLGIENPKDLAEWLQGTSKHIQPQYRTSANSYGDIILRECAYDC